MTQSTSSARPPAGLFVIVIAFSSFIMLGMPDGLRAVAWPSIFPELGTTIGARGVWLTAVTIGYLITSFNSGRIIGRLGAGRALALGSTVMALGMIGYGLAPSWWLLVLIGTFAGLGSGTLDAGMNTFVAVRLPPNLMYWLHACFGLGVTIGPQIMSFIIEQQKWSWRLGYVFAGVVQLGLALVIYLTRQQWSLAQVAGDTASNGMMDHKTSFRETLRLPAVWLSILLFLILVGMELTPSDWGFPILTNTRGIEAQEAANWVSAFWGLFTIGRILPGFITRYVSESLYMRVMTITMVIGALLFTWNPTALIGLLGLPIMGFSIAPLFPALINSTEARVGSQHAANTIGFEVGAAGVGIGLSQWISGQLAERVSLESVTVMIVVIAASLLVLHEVTLHTARRKAAAAVVPAAGLNVE
ncbi:MAG: MFS transporter [Anaerolineae bacterium]|nr:MFS transporter [Anaerolineae bacterium]